MYRHIGNECTPHLMWTSVSLLIACTPHCRLHIAGEVRGNVQCHSIHTHTHTHIQIHTHTHTHKHLRNIHIWLLPMEMRSCQKSEQCTAHSALYIASHLTKLPLSTLPLAFLHYQYILTCTHTIVFFITYFFFYTHTYTHTIFFYSIRVCACVCVCERERVIESMESVSTYEYDV